MRSNVPITTTSTTREERIKNTLQIYALILSVVHMESIVNMLIIKSSHCTILLFLRQDCAKQWKTPSQSASMEIFVLLLTRKLNCRSIFCTRWLKIWTTSCSTSKLYGVHIRINMMKLSVPMLIPIENIEDNLTCISTKQCNASTGVPTLIMDASTITTVVMHMGWMK
jgi:hypothetical protein